MAVEESATSLAVVSRPMAVERVIRWQWHKDPWRSMYVPAGGGPVSHGGRGIGPLAALVPDCHGGRGSRSPLAVVSRFPWRWIESPLAVVPWYPNAVEDWSQLAVVLFPMAVERVGPAGDGVQIPWRSMSKPAGGGAVSHGGGICHYWRWSRTPWRSRYARWRWSMPPALSMKRLRIAVVIYPIAVEVCALAVV